MSPYFPRVEKPDADVHTIAVIAAVIKAGDALEGAIFYAQPYDQRARDNWEGMSWEDAIARAQEVLKQVSSGSPP